MPNHVKNRIEVIGSFEQLNEVIKRFGTHVESKIDLAYDGKAICSNDEGAYCWMDLSTGIVTFRNDPPQYGLPDGFSIDINDAFLMFPDFKKVIPPPSDDPAYNDKPSQDIARNSPNWWMNWNIKHWGSKWGGYAYNQTGVNVFTFETAWANCVLIIQEMSKQLPNVTFKYSWADEDTGYNCGNQIYHNGLLESFIPDGGTKEAYDIAFSLRPDRKENYVLIGDNYQYVEN